MEKTFKIFTDLKFISVTYLGIQVRKIVEKINLREQNKSTRT